MTGVSDGGVGEGWLRARGAARFGLFSSAYVDDFGGGLTLGIHSVYHLKLS